MSGALTAHRPSVGVPFLRPPGVMLWWPAIVGEVEMGDATVEGLPEDRPAVLEDVDAAEIVP